MPAKLGINLSTPATEPHSNLEVQGSVAAAITTITSDTNLSATHFSVGLDAGSNSVDADLPAADTCEGRLYVIKAEDLSNAGTITPDGSDTVEGASGYTFSTAGESILIQSDGISDWKILASYHAPMDGGILDLSQTISATPTQAEVQAITDKIDELLAYLRAP